MSRALQHHYPHRLPPPLTPTSPLDFTHRIPFKELKLSSETLGSGSFGTVYKGRWRGRHVAVKQFRTREEINSFVIEVEQLSKVKHPNIVTLYGASTFSDNHYLIMEYAEGGSLNHLLHECRHQQYDLRHACSWAMQTARGVAYLHELRPKPIMHRDLKPANLLLFSRGKILKICDFGTACTVKTHMTNNTGSASYMAPEVFATSSYLESGDVFSWSIIFWETLARRHPYSQQYSNPYQILWRVKQEGTRPSELENCPIIIWRLITKSWNKEPKARPTMREVANEMEFIYSLTERSSPSAISPTNNYIDIRNTDPKLKDQQPFPICSHFTGQSQQLLSFSGKNQQFLTVSSPSTIAKKELYNHSRALVHRLEMLSKRAEVLEESAKCDMKKSAMDVLEELVELKKQTESKKKELEQQKCSTFQNYINQNGC